MARPPAWQFDLDAPTRAVLVHGLSGVPRPLPIRVVGSDWTRLRADCEQHRLDGLLVSAAVTGVILTDDAGRADAAALEVDLTRRRMAHEAELVTVVGWLAEAGVPTRVLKGVALAHLDHPDPQHRPPGDLDLLVRGYDLTTAVGELRARGAGLLENDPAPGYATVVGKGTTVAVARGPEIDLHRLLVWGPFGVRVRPEDLWRPGRTVALGDAAIDTLDVEATLVHVALHLTVLGWRRALSVRDVGVLLLGDAVDRWARRSSSSWRDRAWLRIERPEEPLGVLEPVATYLELRTSAERAMLRRASLHPAPGTWPTPLGRLRRVVGRSAER